MENANLSKNELIDLIFYGLQENQLGISSVNPLEIHSILDAYNTFCNQYQMSYVQGELDTFKRAACLMVAINRGRLSQYRTVNASIALDAAYKMCEKPYWYIGENHNIPKKLEEINFKDIFANDIDIYINSRKTLMASLIYENGFPLNYNLNLQLLYEVAIMLKHRDDVDEQIMVNQEDDRTKESQKKKVLDFFKKKLR